MPNSTVAEEPVINEALWQAWVARGKRGDLESARRVRIALGIALLMLIVAGFVASLY